jgi:hypothetical protein
MTEIVEISDIELLTYGLEKLDDAMAFFMEAKDHVGCQVLTHLTHNAFLYGEKFIQELDDYPLAGTQEEKRIAS